jgi:catechol-2,3-dioxygenase
MRNRPQIFSMEADLDLRLVSLNTENLEEMTEFYNRVLGREPDLVEEDRLIEYRFEGVLLGLYRPSADGMGREIEHGDNCVPAFRTDDIESELERISEFAEIVYEKEAGVHHWFVFQDPDGNRVEVYQNT